GKTCGRAGRHSEVIEQVSVSAARYPAFTYTAEMDDRRGLGLRERVLGERIKALGIVDVPGCARWIVVRDGAGLEVGSPVVHDVEVTRAARDAPGENRRLGGTLVDLERP